MASLGRAWCNSTYSIACSEHKVLNWKIGSSTNKQFDANQNTEKHAPHSEMTPCQSHGFIVENFILSIQSKNTQNKNFTKMTMRILSTLAHHLGRCWQQLVCLSFMQIQLHRCAFWCHLTCFSFPAQETLLCQKLAPPDQHLSQLKASSPFQVCPCSCAEACTDCPHDTWGSHLCASGASATSC